jgi:hypothetical protein
MTRKTFIKSSLALTMMPFIALGDRPDQTNKMCTVKCFISKRDDVTDYSRYEDLWLQPTPRFSSVASAMDFIRDHVNMWNLSVVNVVYTLWAYDDTVVMGKVSYINGQKCEIERNYITDINNNTKKCLANFK